MIDVVLPLAVLALLLVFADQVRRLISHAITNGTIRRALKSDPASVPLLIAKLENGRRLPATLVAWILTAGACALGMAALFESVDERRDTLQIAAVAGTIGLAILVYARWVQRTAPKV